MPLDDKDNAVSRRCFLKTGLAGAVGMIVVVKSIETLAADGRPARKRWWGFVVDLTTCMGCGACVRACKSENDVPDKFFRTWVERYTFLQGGHVEVDSPDGAMNGFAGDPPVDPALVTKSFFVPKLCNHCENAPCVQVCPVGASYVSPDGVALVDHAQCIGCGYCIQACPYGCRFMNPNGGFADKCTLCYHRIGRGLAPACVAACPARARAYGDLGDPESEVSRLLGTSRYNVLKPELGTHPKCFYIGLDQEVL